MDIINELLSKIKANRKYKNIDNKIIQEEIKNYLKKNKIARVSRQDIKDIRNELHKSYASFQTKKKSKIQIYLNELKENPRDKKVINQLLSITISTKERLNDYEDIYRQIFRIAGKPKTIVDLGAGFNIFSYPLMNLKELIYYSYDINTEDTNIINDYIKIMKSLGLEGKAEILGLRNKEEISSLPSSDIVFMFKLIDLLDKESHKPSEELIKILINKTKFIVASFATKTLTRKPMNNPGRKWFELMLSRNNLKFQSFKTANEIFYVINN